MTGPRPAGNEARDPDSPKLSHTRSAECGKAQGMGMLRIGIVGCGTIGSALARAIDEGRIPALLTGLANRTRGRAEGLARSLRAAPPVLDVQWLARASDLVVEAARGKALCERLRRPEPCGRGSGSDSRADPGCTGRRVQPAPDRSPRRIRSADDRDRGCSLDHEPPDGAALDLFLDRVPGRLRVDRMEEGPRANVTAEGARQIPSRPTSVPGEICEEETLQASSRSGVLVRRQ